MRDYLMDLCILAIGFLAGLAAGEWMPGVVP